MSTTDALSKSPVTSQLQEGELFSGEEIAYVALVHENLPTSDEQLKRTKSAQNRDQNCSQHKKNCLEGRPHVLNGHWKPYSPIIQVLSVVDDLLVRGNRILIPQELHAEILEKIPSGHLRLTKCRDQAQQSVMRVS